MAYKELSDLSPDTTIALGGTNRKTNKANPSKIEGYYLGSRKVDDKKKKSGFSYIHVFKTPTGTVGVWGKTDLDRKILSVTPGTMTLAQFDKMVPTPNGEMYKFKVSVDEAQTIEVVGASQGVSEEGYNEGTSDEEYGALEETTDVGYEDEVQAASLAAAERKAKVEALLKGNKNKSKN